MSQFIFYDSVFDIVFCSSMNFTDLWSPHRSPPSKQDVKKVFKKINYFLGNKTSNFYRFGTGPYRKHI